MTMTSSFQNLITRLADEVSNDRPSQNPTFDKMNRNKWSRRLLLLGKIWSPVYTRFRQVSNDGYLGWKNGSEKCPRSPHTSWIEHVVAVHRASWLSTHRAHVAFTVNVRSAWQAGNERVGGGWWSLHAPVTATPVAIASRASPMQNHPLSRSR